MIVDEQIPADEVLPLTEKFDSSDEFGFLNPIEYFEELTSQIKNASDRVLLQTMSFESDHFTGAIFHLLKQKGAEGIDVRVNIDVFSDMVTDGHMNILPIIDKSERDFRQFRIEQKEAQIKDLIAANVKVNRTNPINGNYERLIPAHGRNHIKLSIIDNASYLGGLNLSDAGFSRPDFMVRILNPMITRQLAEIFENPSSSDVIFPRIENTQILYDGGIRGSSTILSQAISIIESSKSEIFFTSQFFPDGIILRALSKASKRGVSVKVILAEPSTVNEPHSYMFNKISQARYLISASKVPIEFYPAWIHAKLLLADPTTDYGVALAGTHNLSELGVAWGNAEASILSTDKRFLESGKKVIEALLNK